MKYQSVIFDLFGTLVRSFPRQEYDQVNAEMAKAIGVPYSEFWQLVKETGYALYLGNYGSFSDNLQDICCRWGVKVDTTQIMQATKYRYEFMATAIAPEQEVLEVLGKLKTQGLKLGLISNCEPAVPLLWKQSALTRFIDVPVFFL